MKRRNKKIRYYGGKPSNMGYLFGISPSLQGLLYLKATDMNPQADALRGTIIPRAIGSLSASVPAASNAFTNYAARGANLIGTKATEAQVLALAGRGITGLSAGSEITQNTINGLNKDALKAIGGKVAGLNALGYVTAAAGALQGGIGLAQDIGNWSNDRVTGTDLMNASGKSTGVINGRLYDRFESFDKAGTDRYVKQMNTRDTISTIGNGMSIGTSVGSIFGPIGMGIGAGIGALGGWIGSLFGSSSRNDAYEEAKRNWNTTRNAYNLQQEAAAASLGIGDEFYEGRYGAKRGKSSHGGMYGNKANSDYGVVETSEGKKIGPKRSNVSVGESIVDFENGRAHYISGKTSERGKDTKDSVEAPGTPGFIPGFVPNPMTGNYIADDAAPYVQLIEKANQIEDYAKKKSSGKTQQLMLQEAQKAKQEPLQRLKELEGVQDYVNNIQDMRNYKCGKHSYAEGKNVLDEVLVVTPRKNYELVGKMPFYMPHLNTVTLPQVPIQEDLRQEIQNQSTPTPREGRSFLSGLAEFAPYAMLSLYPLNELAHYQGTPIRTENSYIPNQYAEDAIRTMKNRSFDIYNPLQALNNQKRLALYNIRKSGFGPAQQMAMLSSLNANNASQIAGLWAQKRNEDNKYAAETAQMAAQIGEQEAARQQQARAAEIQQKIAAQGKKDEGIGKAWKGFSNIAEGFAKHALSAQQMEEMKKLYKAQIRAYDADYEKNRMINEAFKAGTHDIDGRPILKQPVEELAPGTHDKEPKSKNQELLEETVKRGWDWTEDWLIDNGFYEITEPNAKQKKIFDALLGVDGADYSTIFSDQFVADPRYKKIIDLFRKKNNLDKDGNEYSGYSMYAAPYMSNPVYFQTDNVGKWMPTAAWWNMLAGNPDTKRYTTTSPIFVQNAAEQPKQPMNKPTPRKRQTKTRRR